MAYSYKTYSGTGSQVDFNIAFDDEPGIDGKPYLSSSHIEVYLDAVKQTSGYTIDETSSPPKVTFDSAPSSTVTVKIQRVTPKTAGARVVDFQDGSILSESDLDTAALQNLYIAQEAQDVGVGGLPKTTAGTEWTAGGLRVTEIADPTDNQDAATRAYVDAISTWGSTAAPQVWELAGTGSTNTFTLSSPTPAASINEMFVVYVDGIVQAPTANDLTTVRDYRVTETAGVYSLVFEADAFGSGVSNPPSGAVIYIQNFGYARSVFDSPLTLTADEVTDTPMSLKGTSGQTAKLLSIKTSANTEVASIDVDGDIAATDITCTNATASDTIASNKVTSATTVVAGTGMTATTGDITATTGDIVATAGGLTASVGLVKASRFATYGISGTPGVNEVRAATLTAVGTVSAASADITGNLDASTIVTTGDITVGGDVNMSGGLTGPGTIFAHARFRGRITTGTCTILSTPTNRNVTSVVYEGEVNPTVESQHHHIYKVTFASNRPDGASMHYAMCFPNMTSGTSYTGAGHRVYDSYDSTTSFTKYNWIEVQTQTANSLKLHISDDLSGATDFTLIVF